MAWLNLTMPNQTVKNGLKAKKIKLPQMNFVLEKQLIKFSCTYQPLSFCKIFKKFLEPIQSYEDVPFSGPFVLNKILLVQTIITFIYLLAIFIVQNLKQLFQQIQSYDAHFLGTKWPISQNENFFRKPVSDPCFFHLYLSTCQKLI